MKWVFPATNLPPHGTLIVFASGRDYVRSIRPATCTPISAWRRTAARSSSPPATAQRPWTAVGLSGTGHRPGLRARPGGQLDVPRTHARRGQRGAHLSGLAQAARLEPCARLLRDRFHPDAHQQQSRARRCSIRSTVPVPTLPYTNGLAITGTTAVRAQAVRAGYKPARIQTKTFLFVNDVITSPVMNTAITQDPAYAPRLKPGLAGAAFDFPLRARPAGIRGEGGVARNPLAQRRGAGAGQLRHLAVRQRLDQVCQSAASA